MKIANPQPAQFSVKDLLLASVLTFLGMAVLNFVMFADNPALGCALAVLATVCGGLFALHASRPHTFERTMTLVLATGLAVVFFLFAFLTVPHIRFAGVAAFFLIVIVPVSAGIAIGRMLFPMSRFTKHQVWTRRGLIGVTTLIIAPIGSFQIIEHFFTHRCRCRNGTAAAAAIKAYAEAQEIFHRTDYDEDGVLEYSKSMYGPGSMGDANLLLIAPAFAEAASDYPARIPKAGYFFKVFHGEVGKNYLDAKGNQVHGYAVIAYPACYNDTGRETFLITQAGTIYQRDFGVKTEELIEAMKMVDSSDPLWIPTE